MAKLVFQMPKPVKITGRISSITNSFVNSIIPVIHPSNAEILEALSILQMTSENVRCSYCGDKASEWDHFRPLVVKRRPTGYISEIGNLVPSCGKCNQSKGNKKWLEWMLSDAPQSPKTRQVDDIEGKIACLKEYENWRLIKLYDFAELVGEELWQKHVDNRLRLTKEMKESQKTADAIKLKIKQEIAKAIKSEPHGELLEINSD